MSAWHRPSSGEELDHAEAYGGELDSYEWFLRVQQPAKGKRKAGPVHVLDDLHRTWTLCGKHAATMVTVSTNPIGQVAGTKCSACLSHLVQGTGAH